MIHAKPQRTTVTKHAIHQLPENCTIVYNHSLRQWSKNGNQSGGMAAHRTKKYFNQNAKLAGRSGHGNTHPA
jgi:hypothetical protein